MGKLQDMLISARRAQSSGGIGFVGKAKSAVKPRDAAIIIEFSEFDAGSAEAAIKAGADGILFTWDGKDISSLETLQKTIDAAKAGNEDAAFGLAITGGWDKLNREEFEHLKDLGINYVVLPLHAPAHLLGISVKELDEVVSIPMREGDMYPLFIRNLTAFDIAAVRLDFWMAEDVSKMSIEDILHYRAVREAVRYPALLNVREDITEDDATTLMILGVQAFILPASGTEASTTSQIKSLRELLEKIHEEEKDKASSSSKH
jgi:2-methylisocitrate lyase-like PEP mutase family enzyme